LKKDLLWKPKPIAFCGKIYPLQGCCLVSLPVSKGVNSYREIYVREIYVREIYVREIYVREIYVREIYVIDIKVKSKLSSRLIHDM
jgi:hypothetical protein